jgi:hypothetical protein
MRPGVAGSNRGPALKHLRKDAGGSEGRSLRPWAGPRALGEVACLSDALDADGSGRTLPRSSSRFSLLPRASVAARAQVASRRL